MNKTIGLLAHVDAGKTTFAEQILYHTNSIKKRGRVDHKDAFLDSNSIERERGITVFADQAVFNYKASNYCLVDTPGHIDFSPEMERAISIMDYAVLIISGVEGVQGHTETVWQLLRKHSIPTLFFINKMDRETASLQAVIKEIKESLTSETCFLSEPVLDNMEEELIEFIAERDEETFQHYLEEGYSKELWINTLKKLIKENKVFPCFSGSALQDIGIEEFLNCLDMLTYTEYSMDKEFRGRVYKIRHDEQGNQITFIKALSGSLKVRDEIKINAHEKENIEKISQIRIYNGDKFTAKDLVTAGEVFAVVGANSARVGYGIGNLKETLSYEMIPTLKSKVIFDSKLNAKDVLYKFRLLEAEDPSLNVIWEEKLQELQVHIMGIIQLEVLKEVVKERFNLPMDFGPCEILYKETIEKEAVGYGHFEPLRHYAEIHLKLEPAPRNTGITFENQCHSDDMTEGNQNLVRSHIFEREHHGILTGSSITDIKITLLTGRAHNKHTSGGDFREATFRALRQGLESTKNILLEPYYRFKIEAHIDYMGRILSDIQKFNGSFEAPEINENHKVIIIGRGPAATFMNYGVEFVAITKGKGKLTFIFDGYDLCHNEEEVIKKADYNKNADIEYTSTSIFCSKGQAYLVEGKDAKAYMHCLT